METSAICDVWSSGDARWYLLPVPAWNTRPAFAGHNRPGWTFKQVLYNSDNNIELVENMKYTLNHACYCLYSL